MMNDEDIANFFVMMNSFFGHKFKSSYGTAVNGKGDLSLTAKVWKRTLNQVPYIDEVLHNDLFNVNSPLMESKEWCPDLREVAQICKELSRKYVREERFRKQISKDSVVIDEKVVAENRVKIKQYLENFKNKNTMEVRHGEEKK